MLTLYEENEDNLSHSFPRLLSISCSVVPILIGKWLCYGVAIKVVYVVGICCMEGGKREENGRVTMEYSVMQLPDPTSYKSTVVIVLARFAEW